MLPLRLSQLLESARLCFRPVGPLLFFFFFVEGVFCFIIWFLAFVLWILLKINLYGFFFLFLRLYFLSYWVLFLFSFHAMFLYFFLFFIQLVVICPALCFFSYCSHFPRAALGTPAVSLPSLTFCMPGLRATCLHTWAPAEAPSYSSLRLSVPRGGGKLFCPQGRRKAQPDLCTIFDGGTKSILHQCFQLGLVLLEFGVKPWHLNCFPASRWNPNNFCFYKSVSSVKKKYTLLAYSFLTLQRRGLERIFRTPTHQLHWTVPRDLHGLPALPSSWWM